MEKWMPDLEFIAKIEQRWASEGILDRPYAAPQVGRPNREIVEVLQIDFPEGANYIKNNFSLDEPICDHHLTAKEVIEAMKQGTPYGVFSYLLLEMHRNCCLKL